MSIPIYLAAAPEESARVSGYPTARPGYRLSQEAPALLAPEPPGAPSTLMVLGDSTHPGYEPTPALAGMLANYAKSCHAGLVCDWRRPVTEFYGALAALLDEACGPLALPFWLTVPYAGASERAGVMVGSDVTEGVFSRKLSEAAGRWPGRCILSLRPLRMRCTLSETRETAEMESLPELPGEAFLSEELGCMYFSEPEGAGVAFTLYDTRETMERKLKAAEEAGFQAAIGSAAGLAGLPGQE